MFLRTLSITALAAAGVANAILIPPDVSASTLELGDDMAMEIAASSYPRTVSLDCSTCDFATKAGNGYVWSQSAGNSFVRHIRSAAADIY